MSETVTIVDLQEGVRLHIIEIEKFKTELVGIFLQRPLEEFEATRNALLTRIMEQRTKSYPTLQSLQHKLDNLYGTVLSCDVNKYGGKQVLQFKMSIPAEHHIGVEDLLPQAVRVLNEVVHHPLVEDGRFTDKVFTTELRNLEEEIMGRVNDKMAYAIDRCLELMCDNEPFRIHQYGTVDALQHIQNEPLYSHYQRIVKVAPVDIVVMGKVDPKRVERIIRDQINFQRGQIERVDQTPILHEIEEVRDFEEVFPVKQGKLTLGYRTGLAFTHSLYEAGLLFSTILGGGASSKLFRSVREKESLCYYIFSRIEKYEGLMMISSGIDPINRDRVEELINVALEEMRQGNFTDEDIRIAKDALINSIRSVTDFPNSFMNYYFTQRLCGRPYDPAGTIERIERITKEEIIQAGSQFQLDTRFFIKGEDTGNENKGGEDAHGHS